MIFWQRLRIAAVEAVGAVIPQHEYLIIPHVPRAGRLRLRPFQHAVRRLHDAVMDVHDIAGEPHEPLAIYPPAVAVQDNISALWLRRKRPSDAAVYMPFAELVDLEKEIERLKKEEERLTKELARVNGMLSNEKFISKAPQSKIDEEKEKLEKYTQMMNQVKEHLAALVK